MTLEQFGQIVRDFGLAVAIFGLVVGGVKEWYVWGVTHRKMEKEKDMYRDIALRSVKVAERATGTEQP